jgi:hypothetical protein
MYGIFWSENLMKANGNVEKADLKEREGGRVWNGFVWFKTGTSDGLF